jgi:hypothetical protein
MNVTRTQALGLFLIVLPIAVIFAPYWKLILVTGGIMAYFLFAGWLVVKDRV